MFWTLPNNFISGPGLYLWITNVFCACKFSQFRVLTCSTNFDGVTVYVPPLRSSAFSALPGDKPNWLLTNLFIFRTTCTIVSVLCMGMGMCVHVCKWVRVHFLKDMQNMIAPMFCEWTWSCSQQSSLPQFPHSISLQTTVCWLYTPISHKKWT